MDFHDGRAATSSVWPAASHLPHRGRLGAPAIPVPCSLSPVPYTSLLPAPSVTTGYFLFFTLKKLTKWAAKVMAQEMG